MSIEQRLNYRLNRHPIAKKYIKSVYQHAMYAISPKIRSEGNIIRISPDDMENEYFFGYYDKSPWDRTGRYILCMRAKNTWSDVAPKDPADILLIDLEKSEKDPKRIRKLAMTHSWNVQQGCMLQWLGPDFTQKIVYNDFREGRLCCVVLNIFDGSEQVIGMPVYSVASDGNMALTLDFLRLHSLRPGYGYYNLPDKTKGVALPDETCIWKIDINSGAVSPLLKYADFVSFKPRKEILSSGTVYKVNHLMISPNGERFMVLFRGLVGSQKYTRLITCNIDGSDMYLLSDDDMVSHCFWKNDHEIIAFENKHGSGTGYYLMKDRTQEYVHLWPKLTNDGHPSYSPNGEYVVTDTYPDRARMAEVKVLSDQDINAENLKVVARVFAPFRYDNDTRCDLHPRWSRDGKRICFDAVFEGHRGLYMVEVN